MRKLLFISNLTNKITAFATASIAAAGKMGYSYHHAANWSEAPAGQIEKDQKDYGITVHHIDLARSPFSKRNLTAYKQMNAVIRQENIDYIHCNTPVGGLLGRLAGKKCGVNKVIYQVHGFHFYKGAPKLNWLLYYPVERLLARWTDAIITINHEDYDFAQKKLKLRKGGKVYYVPGVGIDTKAYVPDETIRQAKRQELGLSDDDVMLISAGELNENKNNTVLISALSKLQNKKIHYFLCGVGDKESDLHQQAQEAGIAENIHFLGYRTDMKALLHAADVFVMPSFREGLSRSIMEAMSAGLPCIVSKIRGNVDLVENMENGFTCSADDVASFAGAIEKLADQPELRATMRKNNLEKIKGFDSSLVEQELQKIYTEVFME